MKKIIALLLSIVILATCLPYTTLAIDDAEISRYTVLVLDTSGTASFQDRNGSVFYTADTAVTYVKQAASKFLEDVLDANGTNYVAVVSFKSTAQVVSSFSTDSNSIKNKVNSLSASGTTRDISAGLAKAQTLLSAIPNGENVKKNVVLFTTGMTNHGSYNYSGKFDSTTVGSNWQRMDTGVKLYAYANNAISVAETLKNDATLYTLGLFKTYASMPTQGKDVVELFKLTAKKLATSDEYFYEVDDPNDLEFTFGDIANDIINETKEITFTYASAGDKTAKCYYTNDYFAKSSYIFNSSLATMSMSFAWSAFGSSDGGQSDYSNKSKNARDLLEKIGVKPENIKTNDWFTKKPTTDSIGVIAGNMPITVKNKDYTLIAVAVRGGGYEQEWASNFTIGRSGQHYGFDNAKESVLSFLKDYVSEQKITGDIKFWITGYSRAAATANLVAGAIDNQNPFGNNVKYTNDDVFAYCFETPAGALTSQVKNQSKYNNIFNIINSNDPVPYVAPAALGFSRYGVDKYLPSAQSTTNYSSLKDNMLKVYNSLDSTGDYIVDDFKMKKLAAKNWLPGGKEISFIQDDTENNYSQGVFLSNYVTIVSKEFIKNRNNYVDNYQNQIREICSVMFGCTDEQSKKLMDSLVTQAKNNWGDLALGYLNPFKSEEKALQVVSDWLKKAVKDAGITGYDEKTINSAGIKLGDLMLDLIINHPNYFTTAVVNGSGLGAAHYPELCYSWLASMDRNYSNNASSSFNNGGYRIIRINCPVDVELKDSKGNLLASIVDEKAEYCDSSLIYGIDDDGQKFVVLPISEDYNIEVLARENAKVNIGISEYSAQAGEFTRNTNYFDLDLEEGQLITGILPAYKESEAESDTPNGSTTEYVLKDSENNLILPNSDLRGDEAIEAYYNVNAIPEDNTKGFVVGSGIHQYGQFAQIEAVGQNGYSFVGWYIDGELISSDEQYRVLVDGDIEIVAKFELTCNHICHKTNFFAKLLYKVFCFFWKLFRNNQYCECGAIHY